MELHRFFRYAIEKMCKEKKSLNHFYNKFLDLYPESHNYILSCPFLNIKLKIMMWCLVHHVGVISKFMLLLRYLKNRNL